MARIIGDPTAFWNATVLGAPGTSTGREIARGVESLTIYVTSSAAATITVEVGHHGALTSEGLEPDAAPSVWFPLYYLNTAVSVAIGAAGSAAIAIPDVVARFYRLRSSAASTLTAGWEGYVE